MHFRWSPIEKNTPMQASGLHCTNAGDVWTLEFCRICLAKVIYRAQIKDEPEASDTDFGMAIANTGASTTWSSRFRYLASSGENSNSYTFKSPMVIIN